MLVVNFFGGPGSGKSSLAARVFADLKWNYINSEFASEWAKERVWEETESILNDQLLVFANQYHKLFVLENKVKAVVTDSPLLLSLIYGVNETPEFTNLVLQKFRKFDNLNFFVVRNKPYVQAGRLQTSEKAKELDGKIRDMLTQHSVSCYDVNMSENSLSLIHSLIRERLFNESLYD